MTERGRDTQRDHPFADPLVKILEMSCGWMDHSHHQQVMSQGTSAGMCIRGRDAVQCHIHVTHTIA